MAEPASAIIVGAGIFGLSTALAIAKRFPSTKVTIVDRAVPPVEDATSVDTTRCIRADYAGPVYARLAAEAQKKLEEDPDLRPYYFKQGMAFACDGQPGRFLDIWQKGLEHVQQRQPADSFVEMPTATDVFQRIHGPQAQPVPDTQLPHGRRRWNQGYCNLEDAFIDARETVRIYYERCLAQPSIQFLCGTPVRRVSVDPISGQAHGVELEDGRFIEADVILLATGAWSNRLVDLEGLAYSSAIEVAWVKLTNAEVAKWKHMSITTNLSTGFNMFPPYRGEMKILRRSQGYCNTITVPHPEDLTREIKISYPRTTATHPGDHIPAEAEASLREDLRELMPSLADRPFDRTKLCWLSQTPSADFIIAPHPRIPKLHVAAGGSAHAWKFLPLIGNFVLDSMLGTLNVELADKWRWGKSGSDGGNAPRMGGKPRELRDLLDKQCSL